MRHEVRSVRLLVSGRVESPAHARLIDDIRSCPRCTPPAVEVRVPAPRAEQPVAVTPAG